MPLRGFMKPDAEALLALGTPGGMCYINWDVSNGRHGDMSRWSIEEDHARIRHAGQYPMPVYDTMRQRDSEHPMAKEPKTCKTCIDSAGTPKTVYHSFVHAMKTCVALQQKRHIQLRVYRCPRHQGWHLTGKEQWKEVPDNERRRDDPR